MATLVVDGFLGESGGCGAGYGRMSGQNGDNMLLLKGRGAPSPSMPGKDAQSPPMAALDVEGVAVPLTERKKPKRQRPPVLPRKRWNMRYRWQAGLREKLLDACADR
jgi:hypothetical protein